MSYLVTRHLLTAQFGDIVFLSKSRSQMIIDLSEAGLMTNVSYPYPLPREMAEVMKCLNKMIVPLLILVTARS